MEFFCAKQNFLLLKDRFEDSGRQKIKEIILPNRKSHLVENDFNDPWNPSKIVKIAMASRVKIAERILTLWTSFPWKPSEDFKYSAPITRQLHLNLFSSQRIATWVEIGNYRVMQRGIIWIPMGKMFTNLSFTENKAVINGKKVWIYFFKISKNPSMTTCLIWCSLPRLNLSVSCGG